MMNEAHNGLLRCPRTRVVGRQVIPVAHRMGVRHLAMEALDHRTTRYANRNRHQPLTRHGYLGQPEMQALIQAALDLGWTLIAYEADWRWQPAGMAREAEINWREETQARNLIAALAALPDDARLLVWCGNSHLDKKSFGEWTPMGYLFTQLGGGGFFALDQTVTVNIHPERPSTLDPDLAAALESSGGTAGFLEEAVPPGIPETYVNRGVDAYLLSVDNDLV